MVLEACWLHLCGVNAVESTTCYGELFVDLALVAAASVLFRALWHHQSMQGFVEFSLLYFSILNGWYLYAHHFASRFPETSHIHWLPVGIFLLALCAAISFASFDHAREFSQFMMLLQVAAFCIIARVCQSCRSSRSHVCAFGFLNVGCYSLFCDCGIGRNDSTVSLVV
jgi:low temperature requirement protein LtrA